MMDYVILFNKYKQLVLIVGALVIVVAGIGVGVFFVYQYIISTQQKFTGIQRELAQMEGMFGELASNNVLLQEALENERQRGVLLEGTVKDISGDLNIFKKLSELDPELLKKYSKVYFLSENYVPSDLRSIRGEYLYKPDEQIEVHAQIRPFLYDLIRDAQGDDINLLVLSGYRSFGDQLGLKSAYVVRYGAGTANSFSAEQGYSEHQLGTTVDFTTKNIGGTLSGFNKTPEYQWLLGNAYKHGFVLSYPEGNNYYTFEPWHWRFVGKDLAQYLHNQDTYFYNMPQRDIDEYLIKIFEE